MLSPLCQEFLEKIDSEINDFKNRIETFIETNKGSEDLYNLIDKKFGQEVYDFKKKYKGTYPSLINKNTQEVLFVDVKCEEIMRTKCNEFLIFIDKTNDLLLPKDNKS